MKINIKYYQKIGSYGITSYDLEKLINKYGTVEITNIGGTQYAVYNLKENK